MMRHSVLNLWSVCFENKFGTKEYAFSHALLDDLLSPSLGRTGDDRGDAVQRIYRKQNIHKRGDIKRDNFEMIQGFQVRSMPSCP